MPAHGKRRALGQHFLRDQAIARRIAEAAIELGKKGGSVALLEIGPGKGAITTPLIELLSRQDSMKELILAERDRGLAETWKSRPSSVPVRVEEGDFLDLPEDRWLRPSLMVASNLPYSAGTAILTRLAAHPETIPAMVLMFQAEVARRLRAEPGSKEWGSLSIWIQNRWDVKKLCAVPPRAFSPPPEVDSEVVTLERRVEPRVAIARTPEAERKWESLLKTCFAHRRKMLRSGLPSTGPYREALARAGIEGSLRAEQLTWEDWKRFFEAL